jgi:hypothetical protein
MAAMAQGWFGIILLAEVQHRGRIDSQFYGCVPSRHDIAERVLIVVGLGLRVGMLALL